MTDHFQNIYATKADQYDAMVSREDYQGNLLPALEQIRPLAGLDVVEMGAGTGRLTRLLVPHVRSIRAYDASAHMLNAARPTLEAMGFENWTIAVGENHALPADDSSANLAIAGWSFGHCCGWYPDSWRDEIGKALSEMQRVLKPGGTAIILETMGTGSTEPAPPTDSLATYYHWLENEYDFAATTLRTDYQFESVQEAIELTRFFFGDDLADRIQRENLTILPECTGIWWKEF